MQKNVEELLFNISLDEIDNLNNARKVTKVNKETYANIDRKMVIKKDYFLKNRKVYISKHSRFADFPEHSHNFLELNYMLTGTVKQIINGNEETLHTGDILLMDKDAVHFVKAPGINDLLINLMIPVENLDFESLSSIVHKNHFIFNFLMENTSCEKNHSTYIIFRSSKHVVIKQLLDQIIDKYYSNSPFANEIIRLNTSILFMELLENVPFEVHGNTHQQIQNNLVFEILRIIHQDFRTLTLSQLANQLNYNKNYLSNLIKNKTGKSFKQLQTKERLERAKLLIENTDLTIDEIIYEVGWLNKSHFYSKYKEAYGALVKKRENKQN
ncbi:AraC family transcriptional regulator [Niallia sp.]|uniref:AraC family transcriptional regulator n=1 Tax=Niallia sp. TaxID=2837523 RepID=UPI00289A5CB0|nr:AraC family transcriptional regulator [Niallia sp.]